MKMHIFGKSRCLLIVFCVATAIASPAQTFKVVARLSQTAGEGPNSPLVQGPDGNFYGASTIGGSNVNNQFCVSFDDSGCGTVFRVTPSGELTALYNFCSQANCADGGQPSAALVLGADGNFYGTTMGGGANNAYPCQLDIGCGTIFKITPGGKLTILYNFCSLTNCSDGVYASNLVLGFNGNLYGTTTSGGILNGDAGCPLGCGTIFEITPAGKFTTIYTFCSQVDKNGNCTDGIIPVAGLTQASNGNFYGTTLYGGTSGGGNIFEITPSGKFKQIYSFCSQTNCADGQLGDPGEQLVQAADGNFYGTTGRGGANNGGTFFTITPTGQLTTLYSFCFSTNSPCSDGSNPTSLSLGTDGNFYGTTLSGGNYSPGLCGGLPFGCGIVFEMSPSGQITTLYTLCSQTNCTDGAYAESLVQATNGTFYGLATKGGRPGCLVGGGCGTVFSIATGLGPFVIANPNGGKAGRVIGILGNRLTGTTSVTFNGTTTKFQVISDTYLKAQVPSGATAGTIEVTTPSGTLSSNVPFQVLP